MEISMSDFLFTLDYVCSKTEKDVFKKYYFKKMSISDISKTLNLPYQKIEGIISASKDKFINFVFLNTENFKNTILEVLDKESNVYENDIFRKYYLKNLSIWDVADCSGISYEQANALLCNALDKIFYKVSEMLV